MSWPLPAGYLISDSNRRSLECRSSHFFGRLVQREDRLHRTHRRQLPQSIHSSGWMYSISADAKSGSSSADECNRQDTRPRTRLSFVPMHGSVMMYSQNESLQYDDYNCRSRPGVKMCRVPLRAPHSRRCSWRWPPDTGASVHSRRCPADR